VTKLKSYILNRFANASANYTSWMPNSPVDCEVVESYAPDWSVPDDAGLIVTHMHYRWEEIAALRRIYETTRVPILILADGVLEYRNTWENPGVADSSVFQPVIGHKLACIGKAQARTVEAWGNVGKCEVVGLPRLDEAANGEYLPVRTSGLARPFRILVATANTPAFTQTQRDNLVESLRLVRQRFDLNDTVNGRPVEVTWRLTDGLENEIGLENLNRSQPENPYSDQTPIPIADAIELADAVITTPSTLYLESVMKRRPTAILDFNNSPAYVPSAWTINAPLHLNPVIKELENPPAAKMLFQRTVLEDQLEFDSPAETRMHFLIEAMVEAGTVARQTDSPIKLPFRILQDPKKGFHPVQAEFDSIALYPENQVFQTNEVQQLQQELNQAVTRLGQLPVDLDRKDADITCKNSDLDRKDAHIERLVGELSDLLKKKNADIEKKDQHIESLSELFQTTNARVQHLRQRYKEQADVLMHLKQQLKPAVKPTTQAIEEPAIRIFNPEQSDQVVQKKAA
jgi:chaperonin cofactor prefoldin